MCYFELTHHTTKGYSLYGVHPGLLLETSPGDLFLLPRVGLGLFLYHYLYLFLPCMYVQFSKDMCMSRID